MHNEGFINTLDPVAAANAGLGVVGGAIDTIKKVAGKVEDVAGKIGVGGITQDRILAIKDAIGNAFNAAGYTPREPDATMGKFKVLAADIPNRLTDRSYAPEYERLRKWSITLLNKFNPGLGDFYNAVYPSWKMANGGSIDKSQSDYLISLIKKYPPGTYKGQEPIPNNARTTTDVYSDKPDLTKSPLAVGTASPLAVGTTGGSSVGNAISLAGTNSIWLIVALVLLVVGTWWANRK